MYKVVLGLHSKGEKMTKYKIVVALSESELYRNCWFHEKEYVCSIDDFFAVNGVETAPSGVT